MCTCIVFRTVSEIKLFHCAVPKLLIRKGYYVPSLMPVFIVQVTKLYSLPSIIHFRKFHRHINAPCHSCKHSIEQTSIFGICEDVQHFPEHSPTKSLSTVTTANWRFTPIHMREGRTVLGAKSKLLYSETAISRKPFAIGHMYVYTFWLRITDSREPG
jgi:hypothetical protein